LQTWPVRRKFRATTFPKPFNTAPSTGSCGHERRSFQFSLFRLRALPGADGEFTPYEDENDNYSYEKGAYATIPFAWNEAKQTCQNSLEMSPG
jgi:hypothetical protein